METSDFQNQQAPEPAGQQQAEKSTDERVSKLKAFSQEAKALKVTLFSSPEGRLFVAGIGLALIIIVWISSNFIWAPNTSQVLIGLVATQVLFGRAASMSFGYSVGLEHSVVVPVNMLVETVLVFIFYPLFVFSWRHIVEIRSLKGIIERTRRTAEANKDLIRKYGLAGLFVFVWFPFWMTGPFIGSVIGFMLGFRLWVTMTVVLSGTFVAMLGWAVILRTFHDHLAAYSPYAPLVLVAVLIIIIIGGNILHRFHNRKERPKDQKGR